MAKCDKVEYDKRGDNKPVPIKRHRPKAKSNFMLIKSLHYK